MDANSRRQIEVISQEVEFFKQNIDTLIADCQILLEQGENLKAKLEFLNAKYTDYPELLDLEYNHVVEQMYTPDSLIFNVFRSMYDAA